MSLPQVILLAQKIREESFDKEAAQIALESDIIEDYENFYRVSFADAASEACNQLKVPKYIYPVYLLTKLAHNDIQDWAIENT